MFQVYNAILRQFPQTMLDRNRGNRFTNTITALVSAVSKLMEQGEGLFVGQIVYRGLGAACLPAEFYLENSEAILGYCEFGFMSASASRKVAVEYSGVGAGNTEAKVLAMQLDSVNRGARIVGFSQYPGEEEILFLPTSWLQPRVGLERTLSTEEGVVMEVPVVINAQLKIDTIDEIKERRKITVQTMAANQRHTIEATLRESDTAGPMVKESILRQYSELEERLETRSATWYNDDQHYRAAVAESLETMGFVAEFLEFNEAKLGVEDDEWVAGNSLRMAHRSMIGRVETRLRVAEDSSPEQRKAALELCRMHGIVTDGDGALERRNEVGETPLIQAAADGNLRNLSFLQQAGADVNAVDTDEEKTALIWTAEGGHRECLNLLVQSQASVQTADNYGMTALIYAAHNGHDGCLRALLAAKADVQAAASDGTTALMYSALYGHDGCLRQLLEAKADVESATPGDGRTALIRAAQKGNDDCLRQLLEAKADVAVADKQGNTALKWADLNKHSQCAELLKKAAAA